MRAAQHFWETGDGRRAADHAARAFALDRNDPLVLAHYCTLLAWQGRFDDALELEHRMVTRDPFSLAVRISLANTLLAAGRFDEARTEFLETVEISPDWQAAVDVEFARIMILEKRYLDALAEVQRWPDGVDRDHGLALIYDALGRKPDADTAVQRLLASSEPGAAVRLAEVNASRGDVEADCRRAPRQCSAPCQSSSRHPRARSRDDSALPVAAQRFSSTTRCSCEHHSEVVTRPGARRPLLAPGSALRIRSACSAGSCGSAISRACSLRSSPA
jgi:tetratricopeptide (TPR) repeat protein